MGGSTFCVILMGWLHFLRNTYVGGSTFCVILMWVAPLFARCECAEGCGTTSKLGASVRKVIGTFLSEEKHPLNNTPEDGDGHLAYLII